MWGQKSKEGRREEKETMVTEFGPWNTEEMRFKAEMGEEQSKTQGATSLPAEPLNVESEESNEYKAAPTFGIKRAALRAP